MAVAVLLPRNPQNSSHIVTQEMEKESANKYPLALVGGTARLEEVSSAGGDEDEVSLRNTNYEAFVAMAET